MENINDKNQLQDYFLKNKNAIFKASKNYRNFLINYFVDEDILLESFAMVDSISGKARSQYLLQSVAENKNIGVKGLYYYCDNLYNDLDQLSFAGVGEENKYNKTEKWHMIEFLLTAPELPIVGLNYENSQYAPIYQESNSFEKLRIRVYPDIVRGILDFTKYTFECFRDSRVWKKPDNIVDYINFFYNNLNDDDIANFNDIYYSSNHKDYVPFFSNFSIQDDDKLLKPKTVFTNRSMPYFNSFNVTVVVVTRNRLDFLKKCINSLLSQSISVNKIIIVNNQSTDNTSDYLHDISNKQKKIQIVNSHGNLGGAGGFDLGVREAMKTSPEWISLMDDDCEPELSCYQNMYSVGMDKKNVYVPMRLDTNNKEIITIFSELRHKNISDVKYDCYYLGHAPFNGFTIHANTVEKIGHINKDYSIVTIIRWI